MDSTGLGNLLVGYDEDDLGAVTIDGNRTGSHNLIVGPQPEFTASGSVVAGYANIASDNGSNVTGGACNASGPTAYPAALSTPCFNVAPATDSVSGGFLNTASSISTSVSGGEFNTASADAASVSGGSQNTASNTNASVSGGNSNTASKDNAHVSGGESNTASGHQSAILGGASITVSTLDGTSPLTP